LNKGDAFVASSEASPLWLARAFSYPRFPVLSRRKRISPNLFHFHPTHFGSSQEMLKSGKKLAIFFRLDYKGSERKSYGLGDPNVKPLVVAQLT
jgi:hypothetical protein